MPDRPYLIGIPVGLTSSPLIAEVAERAGSDRMSVIAVFVAMLDQSEAGCIDDWDPAPVAEFFGMSRAEIDVITASMLQARLIRNRVFVNWPAISGEAE